MQTTYQVANAREQQLAAVQNFGADDDVQLALAGVAYAEHAAIWSDDKIDITEYRAADPGQLWPWKAEHWAPLDPRSDLERAAALIIAQVDKIDLARRNAFAASSTVVLADWRRGVAPTENTGPGCFRVRTIHDVANTKQELAEQKFGADDDMQLALAGIAYAEHAAIWADEEIDLTEYRAAAPGEQWPWKAVHWAPLDPRSDLVCAAALIIAQIEKFDLAHHDASAAGD